MANLREIATLHLPFQRGFRGDPDRPEVTRPVWCRINRGVGSGGVPVFTLIIRWSDLADVDSVIGSETQAGSDWEIQFGDESFDIRGIRPWEGNPRQFAEVTVRNTSGSLPFTG